MAELGKEKGDVPLPENESEPPLWRVCLGGIMSMNFLPPSVSQDADRLGGLALKFRGTRRAAERRDIAEEYAKTVQRLIDNGNWKEIPSPEDQLPDDWMPKAFFEYWSRRQLVP